MYIFPIQTLCFLLLHFYLLIYVCFGSLLLCVVFLQLLQLGDTLHCDVWASLFGGYSCRARAWSLCLADSRAQAQQLWHMGVVAPWHMESSLFRDETLSPALAGRFLSTVPRGKSLFVFLTVSFREQILLTLIKLYSFQKEFSFCSHIFT